MYRGRVTNVMDFGCFVELQGLAQRCEGLVHVGNISKTRCAEVASATRPRLMMLRALEPTSSFPAKQTRTI